MGAAGARVFVALGGGPFGGFGISHGGGGIKCCGGGPFGGAGAMIFLRGALFDVVDASAAFISRTLWQTSERATVPLIIRTAGGLARVLLSGVRVRNARMLFIIFLFAFLRLAGESVRGGLGKCSNWFRKFLLWVSGLTDGASEELADEDFSSGGTTNLHVQVFFDSGAFSIRAFASAGLAARKLALEEQNAALLVSRSR